MEISKMVVDREKSATKVVAAARTHKDAAAKGAVALLGEEYGKATSNLMGAAAAALEGKARAMVAADEAHIAELGDDAAGRAERDGSAAELRNVFVGLRDVATTMFGAKYVADLGYEGTTPEDAVAIRRLGERLLDRFDKVAQPAPRFEGMTFDAAPWKQKISEPLGRLVTALERTANEEREAEQTLAAKNRAIAEYDEVFSKTAGLVSALLRIAGETELAERVRPVKSRPGQTADVVAETDASVTA